MINALATISAAQKSVIYTKRIQRHNLHFASNDNTPAIYIQLRQYVMDEKLPADLIDQYLSELPQTTFDERRTKHNALNHCEYGTPLITQYLFSASPQVDVVRVLIKHGAIVDHRDFDSDRRLPMGPRTALNVAADKGLAEIVNLLLGNGAKASLPTSVYKDFQDRRGNWSYNVPEFMQFTGSSREFPAIYRRVLEALKTENASS